MVQTPALLERQAMAPQLRRDAQITLASYDEADNSIEIVWTTGAKGLRFDWYDGEYYEEELSLEPGAVRLDRLNAGACLLDSHQTYSLSSVLGSVVPGTAKVGDGIGSARVRLAKTPDVADIVQKIIDGHIRSVSVGYKVYAWLRTEKEGELPHMLATDWEPEELSMVTVPFDAGAQARSRSAETQADTFPCIIRGAAAQPEEQPMPAPAPAPELTPTPAPVPASDEIRAGGITARRIRELCERSSLDAIVTLDLVTRHEETPFTEATLTDELTTRFAAARAIPPINNAITITQDEGDKYRMAMQGALSVRIANSSAAPADGGELFGHMGTLEIARAYLERSGTRTAHMSAWELAGAALGMGRHGALTTSDFAIALQQAGNVVIFDSYTAADDTWRPLAKEVSATDFRPTPLVGLTGTPEFMVVAENGEYTYASFADIGDSFKLWTAGRIISLSRQLIINDQLGVFGDMAGHLGAGASLHEANSFWAVVLGNVLLKDGVPIFHASHGNLGAASAITTASLGLGRAAMRSQKDRDGTTPITVVPKYLVVGPAKETEAEATLTAVGATAASGVNLFAGKLQLIVEPRITDNSWYLFADPARAPVAQVAYLRGQRGIYTESRVGFEVDGIEHKGRLDFSAAGFDYRGGYKNPGQ